MLQVANYIFGTIPSPGVSPLLAHLKNAHKLNQVEEKYRCFPGACCSNIFSRSARAFYLETNPTPECSEMTAKTGRYGKKPVAE